MPPRLRFLLLLPYLIICLLSGRAAAQTAAPVAQPGRLVFRLRAEFSHLASAEQIAVPALTAALQRLGATQLHQKFPRTLLPDPEQPAAVNLRLLYEVRLPTAVPLDRARGLLLATGAVEYAEPLYVRPPLYQPNDPGADSTSTAQFYQYQFYLKNIRAYGAWDVTRGDSTQLIGITDTGFRLTHEDLRRQLQRNYADPINGLDDDHDGYVDNFLGWDLADNDNDPTFDPRIQQAQHGVGVSGVAAGQADNGVGIAGVGFKARLLPLKIFPGTDAGAFAGYEAVVYAADHGCRVVNMSWGEAGGRSQFEQDVLTYAAVNRDVVLVAAAGNENKDVEYYPASYDHVLSVTGSEANDVRVAWQTYNYRVDLTAPGGGIYTTSGSSDTDYGYGSGSSYAAPIVSGAAALVRSRFPTYTAAQVVAQLRQTTDDTYALPGNAPYRDKLGTGRLNVLRAVTRTDAREVRVVSSELAPAAAELAPGATTRLEINVVNLLRPVANLQITLTSLSPYLTVTAGTFAVPALPTLGRTGNGDAPFQLTLARDVPPNSAAVLQYHLTAADGYESTQYLTLTLNAGYVVLTANDLHLTLTSFGTLGYTAAGSGVGAGVTYQDSKPLLYEGGLVVATSPTRVSDRIRDGQGADRDFYLLDQTQLFSPGARADQQAQGTLRDSLPAESRQRTVGVRVRQQAYAWSAAPRRDYVLLEYQLTNATADTLRPLYAGLFMDWDLPPNAAYNVAGWDAARALGYVYSPTDPTLYAGVTVLGGGVPAYYALDNGATSGLVAPATGGLTKDEKFAALSHGTEFSSAGLPGGADVSQLIGAALPALAPGDSATLTLAVLAAPSLAALQAAADAARQQVAQVLPTRPAAGAAEWQVYPNPAADWLRVTVPAGFRATEVVLRNALGATIQRRAFATTTTLDVRTLPAGLYLAQVRGAGGVLTRRVVVRH